MPRDTEQIEEGKTWVDAVDAADIYATAMTRRDEDEACLNEEETKRAHEQHKNDFMRKLSASTKLDNGKPPAGASVFISSKQPTDAKPAVDDKAAAVDNGKGDGEGEEYVKLQDAAEYFAERMLLEEQFHSSLAPEESRDRYIGYAEKMKLELAGSTIMYNAKPAAGAKSAASFEEAFPGVVRAVQEAVLKMGRNASYKYTECEPFEDTEESDEEYKRRHIKYYNDMKKCLSDIVSSIPKLMQDAYTIDIHSTPAEAHSRKRKLDDVEWSIPDCDYWSDDEDDEQSAPLKKSSRK
tara:strand:- start:885 stop:1769 length:885 start_codon:yes stop_codon:yes gene_type:complete